jgi:hypothetical protein
MTKRGKEIKMNLSNNYNIVCGTVDNKNAKSIYINLSAWGEPTKDEEINYDRVISKLAKCVKQSTYNCLKNNYSDKFFNERTIVDLDMRESGITFGKRSFMNCELTIYQKEVSESINDDVTLEILDKIIKSAVECLDEFEYFKFYQKKS